jgi:hypothetical protein
MAVKNLATSVIVQYKQLVAGKDVLALIEKAYGPRGTFATMQVMAFSSLMVYPITQSNVKRLYRSSTSWPTSPNKLSGNTSDLISSIHKAGPSR